MYDAVDTFVQSTIYYPSGVPMAQNLGPDVAPSYYNALGLQYTENFSRDEQISNNGVYILHIETAGGALVGQFVVQ